MKRIYIAGPMQGIRDFNFPAFHTAAQAYRYRGNVVFNPAERDEREFGGPLISSTGDIKDLKVAFNLRAALADDTQWICREADAIHMLRGWENSKGAQAEWALARALGLDFYYD